MSLKIFKKHKLVFIPTILLTPLVIVFSSCVSNEIKNTTKSNNTLKINKWTDSGFNDKEIISEEQKNLKSIREWRNKILKNNDKFIDLAKENIDFLNFFYSFERFRKIINANKLKVINQEEKTSIGTIDDVLPGRYHHLSREWLLQEQEEAKKWYDEVKDNSNLLNDKDFILKSQRNIFLVDEEIQNIIKNSAKSFYDDEKFKVEFLFNSFVGHKKTPFVEYDIFIGREWLFEKALSTDPIFYENASENVKNQKKYFLMYLKSKKQFNFDDIPSKFKNDPEVILMLIKENNFVSKEVLKKFNSNKLIIKEAFKKGLLEFNELNEELREEVELAKIALNFSYKNWFYLSDKLKKDKEIIEEYLVNKNSDIKVIEESFFDDENLILRIVRRRWSIIYQLPSKIQNNFKLISENIQFLDYDLLKQETKNNKRIIIEFIKNNKFTKKYNFLPIELKQDFDVIREVVKMNSDDFKSVSYDKITDKEFVKELIKLKEEVLEFFPMEVRNDKNIFANLLKNKPNIFKYASKELRNDKELYTVALKKNPKNIWYISDDLLYSKKFILDFVKNNKKMLSEWIITTITREKLTDENILME